MIFTVIFERMLKVTDMPKAGFLCAGKTPLALSGSVFCAYKMMDILNEYGFVTGACHTEITEPFTSTVTKRAQKTLEHICVCCELVITVGCDGFAVSDIMPDITEAVCKKKAAYFSTVLCGAKPIAAPGVTAQQNPFQSSPLPPSRAVSGICGNTLVLNFPCNTSYSTSLLSALLPAIGFAVYNLTGKSARNNAEFKNFLNSSLDFHEVFKKKYIVNN